MRIAVYGGTFNPVHIAHVHLAETFYKRLGFDRILVIPSYLPPHKKAEDLASPEDRIKMCELAFRNMPAEISELEISRGGKSYMADTLTSLKEMYPNDTLFLLMGEDMFLTLKSWYQPQTIFDKAVICAAPRSEDGFARMKEYAAGLSGEIILENIPYVEASSTEIRKKIWCEEELSSLLPEDVLRYIREKKLYMGSAQMQRDRELLRGMLGEKRFYHSLCVAEKAADLAEKYGSDPEKARLAGLLHDILKDTPPEEQLKFAQRFGIILSNTEKAAKKLWHAKIGSAYLENVLSVTDGEVLSAVRYHTTGRRNMTLFEKILFVADFISDDRDYDGVEKIREKACLSLEDAMLEGLSFTIRELAEKEKPIHPDTVEAYNDILEKRETL